MQLEIKENELKNGKVEKGTIGLRKGCLSFVQVLAQSVANVGPSVGPALGIPVVYAASGNGTWLIYVFATITMLLVAYNINQFTKRSASPGSLYTYISSVMGPKVGVIAGWGLILAYIMTGSACLAGFSNYASMLLGLLGIKPSIVIVALIGGLSVAYIAFRDVKLSAKLMLLFEIISTLLIVILFAVVLVNKGSSLDYAQLKLKGVSFDSLRMGLVIAFFAYTGFESSAALGEEAKDPLKTIPKVLTVSLLIVGFLFTVFSYIEITGFAGLSTKLSDAQSPISILANSNGVPIMGLLINIGATISFWSCMVAVITASARVIFYMSFHKILPHALNTVHSKHNTPYKAIIAASFILISVPAVLLTLGNNAFDIFNWLGTIATYGFLVCYTLCVISSPIYLYRNNLLKIKHVVVAIITVAILLVPIIGSVYPVPPYPMNLLPIIFLGWLVVGGIYFMTKFKNNSYIEKNVIEELSSSKDKIQI
ncbi:APC family permease [Clostridium sp. AWRP]|uniref:APC family permease n=1 Tax=Clostridium sp. AWRP TaxID=2212991 RepID=UPI000FD7DFBB|nr:APC family permease [Clostridium sp. AWRP]AZV56455.1 amino acid permease [Clostridium sp. AWRP]